MENSVNKTFNVSLIYSDKSEEKFVVTCSCDAAAMMMTRGLMMAASSALFCVLEDINHREVVTYVV